LLERQLSLFLGIQHHTTLSGDFTADCTVTGVNRSARGSFRGLRS
jgi:hypothetical protein